MGLSQSRESSIAIEKIILDKISVQLSGIIEDFGLDFNVKAMPLVGEGAAYIGEQFAVAIRAYFMGSAIEDKQETKSIPFPKNPWEHFKLKYAPKWFKRRWPVKMDNFYYIYRYTQYNVCPHIGPMRDNRSHVEFFRTIHTERRD